MMGGVLVSLDVARAATTCIDSDGGSYYQAGATRLVNDDGTLVSGTVNVDYCQSQSSDVLIEFSCVNNVSQREEHTCAYGCNYNAGICNEGTSDKPDLIVESVAFYSQDPKLNVAYNGYVRAIVKNIGNARTTNGVALKITMKFGSSQSSFSTTFNDLEPGNNVMISVPTSQNIVFGYSPVEFLSEVDLMNDVDESNESNNTKTTSVVLYPENNSCQGSLPSNAYWWVSGCWSGNGSQSANYQSSNNSSQDCDYRCYTGYQYQNGSCVVPCTDSDSGRSIFVQGVVTVNNSAKYTDQCSNTVLTEWRCEDGIAKSEQIACAYGCANGVCKNATGSSCTDSDGGKESFVKGKISGNYMDGSLFEQQDECISGKQLKEWSCDNNYNYTPLPPITFSDQSVVFEIPDASNGANGCDNKANTTDRPLRTSSFVDNVSQNLSDSSKNISISNVIDCAYGCVDGACKQQGSISTCGNGAIESGEVCDSGNLNGQSCVSLGYVSGSLKCNVNCLGFNVVDCVSKTIVSNIDNNEKTNRLVPANVIEGVADKITLKLNRVISELEQRIIDLETRLTTAINKILTNKLKGQLLLQTEGRGEVWYTSPDTGERFYVADGQAAFGILSGMGKGITSKDLQKVAIGYDPNLYGGLVDTDQDGLPDVLEDVIGTNPTKIDTDGDGFNDLAEVIGGHNPNGPGSIPADKTFAKKLKGIYLDVANKGAAWYINPKDFKRYYVSPITAFNVMKYMSLGITDKDLRQVPVGQVSQ